MIVLIFSFFVISLALIFFISYFFISAPAYKGPVSDHFDGKTFKSYGVIKPRGFVDLLKWLITRKKEKWEQHVYQREFQKPLDRVNRGVTITMVNHTTLLIQTESLNILTDPVWSERVSPFKWIGPKRKAPPGINFEDLPHIDFILLSHNHYDHLDINTLKLLCKRFTPLVYTGLGVGRYLTKNGIEKVTEMDWWDNETYLGNVLISCVPAQHFSGRGGADRDKTLWCGFVLQTSSLNIYFAGDTGFGPHFKMIAEKFPVINLALIPIGAYKPIWFMSPVHISPAEAVEIHKILNVKKSIATHFGTFALADEGAEAPVADMTKALEENGINLQDFIALNNGESIELHF